MLERYPPDDPREWLNRAYSDLTIARAKAQGVYLEDLCFHTQQAAEKAIKALLIKYRVDFPYVHDIAQLLTLLEHTGHDIPGFVREAERLTQFAVFTRYPGMAPAVKQEEHRVSVMIAEQVVRWAESIILS